MLDRPDWCRDGPEMVDLLSAVLELLEARSLASAGFEAGGRWAVAVPAFEGLKFNAVLTGEAHLLMAGRPTGMLLKSGDCFMLARGTPFVLASDPSLTPVAAEVVFADAVEGVASIGDGRNFRAIGGKMALDDLTASLLIAQLPEVVVIRNGSDGAEAMQWLLARFTTEIANDEVGRDVAAGNLIHLMFTELIRSHLKTSDAPEPGWLSAQNDRRIAPALRLIHEDPRRTWSLAELAHACAMSRSNFAARFRSKVGLPALDYLLRWRMQLARREIRRSAAPLGVIADRFGYSSESSFGHAFKRVFGTTPGSLRRTDARSAGPMNETNRPAPERR